MPLSPEEIRKKSFSVVYGRGYDRTEVAEFLETAADDLDAVINNKSEPAEEGPVPENIGAEIQKLLRAAGESAVRIQEKAEQDAVQIIREAQLRAEKEREKAERNAAQIRERTKQETEARIADAKQRALEILQRAEKEADEIVGDAHDRKKSMMTYEALVRERIEVIEGLVQKVKDTLGSVGEEDPRVAVSDDEPPPNG